MQKKIGIKLYFQHIPNSNNGIIAIFAPDFVFDPRMRRI